MTTNSRADYDARIERWRDRLAELTLSEAQAEGFACVACGHNELSSSERRPFVVVGYGQPGVSSHLLACTECDALPAQPSAYSIADAERAAHIDEIHRLRAQLDIANAVHDAAATNYKRQIAHLRAQLRARRTRTRKVTAS